MNFSQRLSSAHHRLFLVALSCLTLVGQIAAGHRRDERGDVPGWVMITVMTAGLVAVLSVVAREQLRDMLERALNSVGG